MPASVLCVDNDRNLCQILAKALEGAGHSVREAYDGDRALAALGDQLADIVLLDVMLPRRDGFEVLEAIRGLDEPGRATPVVMLTGCSPTPEYAQRAARLGAVALLTKPVALEELLGIVQEHARESKPAIPRDADGCAPAAASEVAGAFDQLPFPALLHHLHGLRATGVLHLAAGRKRKWIQLRGGHPVAVRSNLVSECLGNYLVRQGRISQRDLERSLPKVKAGRRQGEILVAMDALSEEEVAEALRAQGDEKLFEIFGWESGTFRLELGARLQRANTFGVERSPANVVLHGVRTRFSLMSVREFLESRRGQYPIPGRSPFYQFQEIDLDPEEVELFRHLDGSRRLAELIERGEATCRTLYALIVTGMLELTDRPSEVVRGARQAAHVRPTGAAATPEDESEQRARLAAMAERVREQNHWEILGVGHDASEEEVRSAFSRMAERTHPDRVGGASAAVKHLAQEVFGHVSRAYETLIDPRTRQEYILARRRQEREAAELQVGRNALAAELEFQRGEEHLRQRSPSAALSCFGKALEIFPEEGEYHSHYGWALHLCHPKDPTIAQEAMEHLRRGIKLASDREKPYLFMGQLCKAMDRLDVAEKMFTRAVQIQPECVEALRELRLINMRREKSRGFIRRILRR